MLETIVVILIVGAALAYGGWLFYRAAKGKGGFPCCKCGDGPCDTAQIAAQPSDQEEAAAKTEGGDDRPSAEDGERA